MSPPEIMLWNQLRGSQLGFKVRRQHPIGPYVVDFFVRDANLVIEIDGSAHDFGGRPSRDEIREHYMIQRGFRIVRLAAVDVIRDLDAALKFIAEQVTNPLHHAPHGSPPHPGEDS